MTLIGTVAPQVCPRCRGRLFTNHDPYGVYSTCFSCGFVHEWMRGPALDLPDNITASGRQRRRQPSHGKQQL